MTSAAAFSRRAWWAEPAPDDGSARAAWARSLREGEGGQEVRALLALYEHAQRRTTPPITAADGEADPEWVPVLSPEGPISAARR